LSTSRSYFRTHAASNPTFHTKYTSTALRNPKSSIKPVSGAVINELSDVCKTKRRLLDRKTENYKAPAKIDHSSAIADHVKTTGHNIK